MTTPLKPLDREAWEKRLIHLEWHVKGENSEDIKVLRDGIVRDILAIQSQLTEALAEVERLRGIVGKVHSMAVQANVRGEYVPTGFILEDIEKARQPK